MNIWVENQAHRKSANSYAEMICFYSLNKLTITFLLSLSSLLFFSCSKESGRKCFGTTGKDTKVIHSLAPFSEISIDDFFAVYLKQDTSDFIEIEAGEKLLPRIRFEQSGNNLRLANDNICNWSRDYSRVIKLTVHFKTLMLIEVNEACDIFSIDTIQSDSLNIVINTAVSTLDVKLNCKKTYLTIHAGTGDFTLSGISPIGYYYSMGTAFIHAENLISEYVYITCNTTGDSFFHVNDRIDAELMGSGDVYYSGSPVVVNKKEKNSGRVLKRD